MRFVLFAVIMVLSSMALAEPATPSLSDRMLDICSQLHNRDKALLIITEAQRQELVEQVTKLQAELSNFKTRISELEKKANE